MKNFFSFSHIQFFKLIILLFIICQSSSLIYGQNYFVDKYAAGNNFGTSWIDAWQNFSSVNWSLLGQGDTLFISGGQDSVIYYELLDIRSSGAAGNILVITGGKDPGHDGAVIIDGQNNLVHAVNIEDQSYVKVSGLKVRNAWDSLIDIEYSSDIEINSVDFFINGRSGVTLRESQNCVVSYCTMNTGSWVDEQTDGIYSQENSFNVYHHNTIIISNHEPDGHDDGIQMYKDHSMIVHSNFIWQNNTKTSNAQGIYGEEGSGVYEYYNNVVYSPYGANHLTIRNINIGTADAKIYNNTVIAGSGSDGSILYLTECPNPEIKNNILVHFGDANAVRIYDWNGTTANINHNLIYSNSVYPFYFNGSNYSWFEWQQADFDKDGINANPLLVDIDLLDFTLLPTSPAIDEGTDLGTPYNIDRNGITRPQGLGWDLGAHEFLSGPDLTAPKVISAQILDSMTIEIVFSEALEESGALTVENYSISNNISVLDAQLNSSLKVVTLSTSAHQRGNTYDVTVSNVTDLAGNPIDPVNNTAEYYFPVAPPAYNQFPIKFVLASSTSDPDYPPEKTIDGLGINEDPDSRWAAIPMPQWLVFELNEISLVGRTRFSFYGFNFGRIYEYSVLASTDSVNWMEIVSNAHSVLEEWTENDFEPVEAKYIKLLFITSNQATTNQEWAHLWEGEIWGLNDITNSPGNDNLNFDFDLHQNFPNPFNPFTNIRFFISSDQFVTINLFNSLGEKLITVTADTYEAGTHQLTLDMSGYPSGIYYYRFVAGGFSKTKKMILLK